MLSMKYPEVFVRKSTENKQTNVHMCVCIIMIDIREGVKVVGSGFGV
jgi:hypothetical protein